MIYCFTLHIFCVCMPKTLQYTTNQNCHLPNAVNCGFIEAMMVADSHIAYPLLQHIK